jgi:hypothetical protein
LIPSGKWMYEMAEQWVRILLNNLVRLSPHFLVRLPLRKQQPEPEQKEDNLSLRQQPEAENKEDDVKEAVEVEHPVPESQPILQETPEEDNSRSRPKRRTRRR